MIVSFEIVSNITDLIDSEGAPYIEYNNQSFFDFYYELIEYDDETEAYNYTRIEAIKCVLLAA